MHTKATPADLSREAEFNLEHFLRKLTLEPMIHAKRAPPMPARKARSTMTPLTMKPGGYRKLSQIKRIAGLETEVTFYFNNLNAGLGDGSAFKTLKLPTQQSSMEIKATFAFNPYEVENRPDVMFALERGPIMSTERLVHALNEEVQDWHFFQPRRNGTLNCQSVEPVYFCQLDDSQGMEDVRCVVVPLAPWEFSPQDFEDFTCMAKFIDGNKSMDGKRNARPWRNADKMWAYLHDLCLMHECQHFILTSYEQWAFGGFSAFFTKGYVSEATSWDAKPTSVLELFTYWVLAACHTDNTIMLEKVPMEKHIDCDLFEKERQLYGKRLLNDGLMGAGPDLVSDEGRPTKRVRRDLFEKTTGWEPLANHVSTRFTPPTQEPQEAWSAAEHNFNHLSGRQAYVFAKPLMRWNSWQKNQARQEKENPSEPSVATLSAEQTKQEKDDGIVQPEPPSRLQFGRPIACYSLDDDRETDCFRPDLISITTFPTS